MTAKDISGSVKVPGIIIDRLYRRHEDLVMYLELVTVAHYDIMLAKLMGVLVDVGQCTSPSTQRLPSDYRNVLISRRTHDRSDCISSSILLLGTILWYTGNHPGPVMKQDALDALRPWVRY